MAQVLREWDITQTEKLVEKIEAEKQRRKEEEQKRHEEECNKLEDEVATAEKQNDAKQKQVRTTKTEHHIITGMQKLYFLLTPVSSYVKLTTSIILD